MEHEVPTDGYLMHHQYLHTYQTPISITGLFKFDWPKASEHPLFYVGIYAAIGLTNALSSVLSVTAQYTGALRASRILFKCDIIYLRPTIILNTTIQAAPGHSGQSYIPIS